MKYAVVSQNSSNPDKIKQSHKNYANKINVSFVELPFVSELNNRFQLAEILNVYDRIIYLSEYTLIRDDCPNLFELVNKKYIGMMPEGLYDPTKVNDLRIANNQYNYNIKEDEIINFYNCGVIIASRRHKFVFKLPDHVQHNFIHSDPIINLNILKDTATEVQELSHLYNTIQSVNKITGDSRHAAFIINYYGVPSLALFNELVDGDCVIWKNNPEYKFKKHILIKAGGGLGDQVAAEPLIRHLCKTYKDEDISILSHWPVVYKHLAQRGFKVFNHDSFKCEKDVQYKIFETCPSKDYFGIEHIQQTSMHPLDFSSLVTIKTTLPIKDRQIKYELSLDDISNLFESTERRDFSNCIVLHPGKGWITKTFPADWWRAVISKLTDEGYNVILIGKDVNEEQGTVEVLADFNGVEDLRNLLTIGGLFAVISLCPLLITNDSSPLHIAGAFDNNIIYFPTCKHPDTLTPWRNQSLNYKTHPMIGKHLLRDKLNFDPCDVKSDALNKIPEGYSIEDFIPRPQEVINKTKEIMENKNDA